MVNMSARPDLIDHEIRLRQIEKVLDAIEKKNKSHQEMIKNHFTWIIGTVVTSVTGLILHAVKLI